ncbi:DEAD/DEAH box helicase [Candidatus Woesearchaeota archaeon]|nr:DEAD/DEAH box helicase [Candidatus Woesearchaeota archaeon]
MTDFHGFQLDKFQEDAISAVDGEHSVVVSAPTGSGKTLIADYIIDKELQGEKRVVYTAPIKALSNQKYKDFTEQYGEDKIGLITGDLVINPRAQVLIMTTEVYRNMAITKDSVLDSVSYCIMDEIHYLGDYERGYVWEESIIFSPDHVRFLFLSATIPNSDEFADWVKSIKHHDVSVIKYDVRPVPLRIAFFDPDLGITDLKAIGKQKELDKYPKYENAHSRKRFFKQTRVQKPKPSQLVKVLTNQGRLPCIYFVFSRAKTQEYATNLAKSRNFLNSEETREMASLASEDYSKMSKEVKSLNSTKYLRECLSKGVAFHHAGLLPDTKAIVEKLFGKGLIKVLFATETFAVGINMPAKTVCFDGLRKYTETGFRYLNSKEFFQISGRAGRRGIDKEGLSVSMVNRTYDELKKIEQFTKKDDLAILSQFRLSPNTVLNMINMHTPEQINIILQMNFFTFQQLEGKTDQKRVLDSIRRRYDNLVKDLTRMEYIDPEGHLTHIGMFTTQIFSEEIEISQLFAGKVDFGFDEYLILVTMAALTYEERREAEFYNTTATKQMRYLEKMIRNHPYLKHGKWMRNMAKMTAIVNPIYHDKGFIELLKNTNLLEGDIIRLLMRMIDKLEQIDRATDDRDLRHKMKNCKDLIRNCLKGIHLF